MGVMPSRRDSGRQLHQQGRRKCRSESRPAHRPQVGPKSHLSTFHSLGANILREDIDTLGYKKPFTILDQGDQKSVVKDAMKELKLDPKVVDPRKACRLISRAKMGFCEPKDARRSSNSTRSLPYARRSTRCTTRRRSAG